MARHAQESRGRLKRFFMKRFSKSICVVGLGYIGLPTSALLADMGYIVSGVDIDSSVVDTINNGGIHIAEPDLDNYVKASINSGNLKAYIEPQHADVYMICVPTPILTQNDMLSPDLSYVYSAAKSISHLLKEGDMVILESTSPVGTTDKIRTIYENMNINTDSIYIAYCPERVLPGNIMSEIILNDRIVGGVNNQSTRIVSEFYETFVKGSILKTTAKTAEMCKLAENSFRDINIAYANELSMICDNQDIDVWELIKLANRHPRVNILRPGTGVGGHCIAVDPWFIVSENQKQARIIKEARLINDAKPKWVAEKIINKANLLIIDDKKTPTVACFGLAFKPDIDDFRESPAIKVIDLLIESGINVIVVEPNIDKHDSYKLVSFDEALEADIIALLVGHKELNEPKRKSELIKLGALDFCGAINH